MTDEYADAQLQRAISEDAGIAELGIDIVTRGDCVVLNGHVESPERREAIERLVTEHLPGLRLLNEIVVLKAEPPGRAEELP
jgi:osmotically-inducible protein OsmY